MVLMCCQVLACIAWLHSLDPLESDWLYQVEEHKKKDPAVLAVFKNAEDPAFKAYEQAAGGMFSDYDFAHTFDAALVEEVRQLCSSSMHLLPLLIQVLYEAEKPASYKAIPLIQVVKVNQAIQVGMQAGIWMRI